LILPHNINFMHQEHSIAENIISMCFDVTGFSKDNVNVRKDLASLCNHASLESKRNAKGNLKRSRAPYCLKPTERKEILSWLKKLKFLDCYASNIKWAANVNTSKLNGLKSHDYHIIIQRLMPIMFRGYCNTPCYGSPNPSIITVISGFGMHDAIGLIHSESSQRHF
jgi:hypothetical protein